MRRRSRPRARRRRQAKLRGSRMFICSRSSRPGSRGEPIELAGEIVGVEAIEQQVRRRRHGPPPAVRRGAGRPAAPAPPGTRRQRAARSPTTSTAARRRRPRASRSADFGGREAAVAARPRRAGRARADAAANSSRHLADDPHVELDARRSLRGLDQQLRPLVRVGRAEEGDRQLARRRRPGSRSRPSALPDLGLVRHRLAHDVDQLRVVADRDERAG